ncbi:MAG: tetrahydrofolate dehydrogenase/cyclohydrolase catalytic domain-containing protein [Lachnospiraceae bacterium]|nr:tetrahydrofolate dehydrogenase/cyclohydrolase catalytic domain-containing protein [Lachnospiraceae bacterium]
MSTVMLGTEVAKSMKMTLSEEVKCLKEKGVTPCLTIIRVGAREDDLAYERGAKKCMEIVGIECRVVELPENISQDAFENAFAKVNDDPSVDGILLFRPLPSGLDEEQVKMTIRLEKDVDCMNPVNSSKVFLGETDGYAPCTAQAVMEMLHYYKIDLAGMKTTVVGRSMVVGKPLSMMLLNEHATVTICHTRTKDLKEECKDADLIIACAGCAKIIKEDMIKEGAVVVDVGINVDEEGNLCGDVDYEHVKEKASYISPVPRGVGSVTTSVLASHVVKGASRRM